MPDLAGFVRLGFGVLGGGGNSGPPRRPGSWAPIGWTPPPGWSRPPPTSEPYVPPVEQPVILGSAQPLPTSRPSSTAPRRRPRRSPRSPNPWRPYRPSIPRVPPGGPEAPRVPAIPAVATAIAAAAIAYLGAAFQRQVRERVARREPDPRVYVPPVRVPRAEPELPAPIEVPYVRPAPVSVPMPGPVGFPEPVGAPEPAGRPAPQPSSPGSRPLPAPGSRPSPRPRATPAPRPSPSPFDLLPYAPGRPLGLPRGVDAAPRGVPRAPANPAFPPSPVGLVQPLPDIGPVPLEALDRCNCPKPRKRESKPKPPRTVCWQGTYTQRAKGISYARRRQVPCSGIDSVQDVGRRITSQARRRATSFARSLLPF